MCRGVCVHCDLHWGLDVIAGYGSWGTGVASKYKRQGIPLVVSLAVNLNHVISV